MSAVETRVAGAKAPLGVRTKVLYGLGTVAFGVKDQGFSALLMLFYNQVVGLPPAEVGLAIMIAMIADAAFDPVMGQISDDWRSRWGRRHPFMYAAAIPVGLTYLLLWMPPAWSQHAQFYYLVFTAIGVRACLTVYEIPSTALLAEFSDDYDERTSLVAYRYFFGVVGGLAMNFVAFTFFLKPSAAQGAGQLNAAGYAEYGMVAAVVMVAAILLSTWGTHHRIPMLRVQKPRETPGLAQILKDMRATLFHKSYLSVLAGGIFAAMASGVQLSLGLYFNTYVWQLSADAISVLTLAGGRRRAARLHHSDSDLTPHRKEAGRHRPAGLGDAVRRDGAVPAPSGCVSGQRQSPPDPDPRRPDRSLDNVCHRRFDPRRLDDRRRVRTGAARDRTPRRRPAVLRGSLVAKAVSGLGTFVAGLVLAFVSFPEHAKVGEVGADVLRKLILTYLPLSTGLSVAAVLCMAAYPISRSGHYGNLARLAGSNRE